MSLERKTAATRCAVVVNDDSVQRTLITSLLEREGLKVQAYPDAEAALAQMSLGLPPDLVVTDLYMPGIDGWRFCHLLRSPEYKMFNQVPIVVVSATFAGAEARAITADLGANAFVTVPLRLSNGITWCSPF